MQNKNILLLIFIILLLLIAVSLIFNTPPLAGRNGLLKECRFDEFTGEYDKCFWVWDESLDQPSIYF